MLTTAVPPPSMTNLGSFWAFRPEKSAGWALVWDEYQPQVQYASRQFLGQDAFSIITMGQASTVVPSTSTWTRVSGIGVPTAQRRLDLLLAYCSAYLCLTDFHRTHASQSTAWPVRRVWLGPVTQRLAQLAQLERDWDSYGGEPPTETAQTLAREYAEHVAAVLGHVVGDRALPSSISPLAYGGIELEWRGSDALVAVDVGPEGDLGYLLKQGHGPTARYWERDNATWGEALAQIVGALLPVS